MIFWQIQQIMAVLTERIYWGHTQAERIMFLRQALIYCMREKKVIRSSDNSSADNKKIIQILSSLVSSAQPIVIPLDGKVIAKTVGKYIPITPELTDAIRRVQ